MIYYFSVFDELINESISFNYSGENNREKYIDYLNENFSTSRKITIGKFKKEKDLLQFQNKKVLYSIHPDAPKYVSQQLQLFEETELAQIDSNIIEELKLEPANIKRVLHQKQMRTLAVGFLEDCCWEQLSTENLKYYFHCGLLLRETEKIIMEVKSKVHANNSKKEIEQYIHKHQNALIALCVKVLNQLDFERNPCECSIRETYSNQDVLNLIYHYIEKILRFIESNYLAYINKNITIPYKSKLVEEYELQAKCAFIKSILIKTDLNSEIRTIVLTPIFKLNQLKIKERITYRELIYYNVYISQLHNELLSDPEVTEKILLRFLFQINYNSQVLIQYLFKNLMLKLKDFNEESQQLDYLYRELKETNQQSICTHLVLEPAAPNLKKQLSSWLEEEIQYLHKNQNKQNAEASLFPPSIQRNIGKIQANLSVSELALLFRLFHDTECISHENQSELIQFIADNFHSKKVGNISVSSLRTKYYSPENGAIITLKKQIEKMLELISNY